MTSIRTARRVERNRAHNARIDAIAAEIETARQADEHNARIARIQATPPAERTAADVLALFGHHAAAGLARALEGNPYVALLAELDRRTTA